MTVHLEVEDDRLLLIKGRYEVLAVSRSAPRKMCCRSFPVVRLRCFQLYVDASRLPRALLLFNLGGAAHEIGVRQVAHYLGTVLVAPTACVLSPLTLSRSRGNSRENRRRSDGRYPQTNVVRAASKVAERYGVQALVTGKRSARCPARR